MVGIIRLPIFDIDMSEIMKPFRITLAIVAAILATTACSPLHKTQKKAVNEYFQTIARFPEYPRELKHYSAKVRMNRHQIYPESFDVDSVMIENLISSYETFQMEENMSKRMDSILSLMDNYITKYYSMTPDGFWLYKGISSGASIFGQFLGFGSMAKNFSREADKNNIIKVGGRKIRNHMLNQKKQIKGISGEISAFADSILNKKLDKEGERLKINYREFLRELSSQPDAYEYYAVYNEIFMRNFRMLHHTEQLARRLKEGAQQLNDTHLKLCTKLEERNKMDTDIPEMYQLLHTMNKLQKTVNSLKRLEETVPGTIKVIPLEQRN